jgi:hypothetical protein
MKMNELRKKAKALGIKPGKTKKTDLVHSIQSAEGYTQCYGNSNGNCAQTECCFRDDCFKANGGT